MLAVLTTKGNGECNRSHAHGKNCDECNKATHFDLKSGFALWGAGRERCYLTDERAIASSQNNSNSFTLDTESSLEGKTE